MNKSAYSGTGPRVGAEEHVRYTSYKRIHACESIQVCMHAHLYAFFLDQPDEFGTNYKFAC